jgi:hypothetical protein
MKALAVQAGNSLGASPFQPNERTHYEITHSLAQTGVARTIRKLQLAGPKSRPLHR